MANDKDLKYRMSHILIKTFIKQIDNNLQMSALDFVHCANAILEYPSSLTAEINKQNALRGTEESDPDLIKIERIVNREDNFWSVYHNLLNEDAVYLNKAIEVAVGYQTAIVREARRIIEDKKVKATTEFRYCILTSQYFEQKFTPNFLSLQKLAALMIEIYAALTKAKPLAICVLDPVASMYAVVGVMPMISAAGNKKK